MLPVTPYLDNLVNQQEAATAPSFFCWRVVQITRRLPDIRKHNAKQVRNNNNSCLERFVRCPLFPSLSKDLCRTTWFAGFASSTMPADIFPTNIKCLEHPHANCQRQPSLCFSCPRGDKVQPYRNGFQDLIHAERCSNSCFCSVGYRSFRGHFTCQLRRSFK